MFKVVPDQLRISEGWVRCGKCEEIFDASANLQEESAQETAAAVSTRDAPDTVPFEGALAAAMAAGHAPVAAVAQEPALSPASGVDFELKDPHADGASVFEATVASSDFLPDGSAYGVSATEARAAAPQAAAPAAAGAGTTSATELSFMRDTRKSSRWHRPLVRATLWVACLLLVLGLALQFLVQERDRIAAVEPGLRPVLEEVCRLLECQVRPLRQIESVVIDSSAFSKIRGDMYRLSLTLKNNAPVDLALPAIELALTDSLDVPVVRRVFRPEELGVRSGLIAAASETQATMVLTIKTNGNGNSERVAGYRLLAFYP